MLLHLKGFAENNCYKHATTYMFKKVFSAFFQSSAFWQK